MITQVVRLINISEVKIVLKMVLLLAIPSFFSCVQSNIQENRELQENEFQSELHKEAFEYLTQNRKFHTGEKWGFVQDNKTINFTIDSFQNIDVIKEVAASRQIEFEKIIVQPDSTTVSDSFIAEQLNQAINTRSEVPWGNTYSKEQFFEYVLPYRVENEMVEDWCSILKQQYHWVLDSLQQRGTTNPVEAYWLIEKEVNKWYKYDDRSRYLSPSQSFSEMIEHKVGECEDFIVLYCYILRSLGIACAKDIIYWGNRNFIHTEISVIDNDGEFQTLKKQYFEDGKKPSKVYRRTFSPQPNCLPSLVSNDEDIPKNLNDRFIIDVTDEYAPAFKFNLSLPDVEDEIVYVCCFSAGKWVAVDWSKNRNGKATFQKLVPNVVYLPAVYKNNKFVGIEHPLVMSDDGNSNFFRINKKEESRVVIPLETDEIFIPGGIHNSEIYMIFYYNEKWCFHSEVKVIENGINVKNIPSNAIYLVINKSTLKPSRIFTIESDTLLWR